MKERYSQKIAAIFITIILCVVSLTSCSQSDEKVTNMVFENGHLNISQDEFVELYEAAMAELAEYNGIPGQYYLAFAETGDEPNCTIYDLYYDGNDLDVDVILYDNRIDIHSIDYTDNHQYDISDDYKLACIAASLAQKECSIEEIGGCIWNCIDEMYSIPYVERFEGVLEDYTINKLDDISFVYTRFISRAGALGYNYYVANIFSIGQNVPTNISKYAGGSSIGELKPDGTVALSEDVLTVFVDGLNYINDSDSFSSDVSCTWEELSGHLILHFEESGNSSTAVYWTDGEYGAWSNFLGELQSYINFSDYREDW